MGQNLLPQVLSLTGVTDLFLPKQRSVAPLRLAAASGAALLKLHLSLAFLFGEAWVRQTGLQNTRVPS